MEFIMAKQVIILNTTPAVGGITAVDYAFWLVPSASAIIPAPGFNSAYAGASAAEINALQTGAALEIVATTQYPSSFALSAIETDLLAKYAAAQTALTAETNPIQWYGTYYDGVSQTWTAQSLSLPSLAASVFASASWISATTLNTVLELPSRGASAVLVPITIAGSITAGAISFQASSDGLNWHTIQGTLPGSFQPIAVWSLVSGSTAILFNVAGYSFFRAILTTAITGTGTATLILQSTTVSAATLIVAGAVGTYSTTAPTPTNGSGVPLQTDASGNLFVKPIRRSQTVAQTTTVSTATATTILAAQAAGIFADISQLVITVTSSSTAAAFTVTLSDGTKSYIYDMNVNAAVGCQQLNLQFNPPLPATTAATAWTLTSSVAHTIHVTCEAVLQQAS